MFEQQQDTGKSASLAEKYANMRDQMSTAVNVFTYQWIENK